jgi:hypothetical protein
LNEPGRPGLRRYVAGLNRNTTHKVDMAALLAQPCDCVKILHGGLPALSIHFLNVKGAVARGYRHAFLTLSDPDRCVFASADHGETAGTRFQSGSHHGICDEGFPAVDPRAVLPEDGEDFIGIEHHADVLQHPDGMVVNSVKGEAIDNFQQVLFPNHVMSHFFLKKPRVSPVRHSSK